MEIDHTKILELAAQLRDAGQSLRDMADEAGIACQVKRLSSDRLKNLLAKYVELTPKTLPMSQRQSMARVIPEYHSEFEEQANQLKEAEQITKRYESQEKLYESCRSLYSQAKKIMWNLDG